MEDLETLLGKLKEQIEQKDTAFRLLVTIKQMELAILSQSSDTSPAFKAPSRISVVIPESFHLPVRLQQGSEFIENPTIEPQSPQLPQPQRLVNAVPESHPIEKEWILDPFLDIPTLSQQPASREINDVMGNKSTTLNDRLKEPVMELATALKDTPVRELRKAIGVNDRFVFIQELFRGDEAMYERSIKTINNFRIMAEAEYWIERELKIKLGWDDGRDVTQHFYQLVKRRFS